MLGKLIKYEFKSGSKIMFPVYIGMASLALIVKFVAFPVMGSSSGFFTAGFSILLTLVFSAAMFMFIFAPLLVSACQFKRSILGSEGYLTMSLPVSSHSLIFSRLITNAIWYVLCGILGILICALMISDKSNLSLMRFNLGFLEAAEDMIHFASEHPKDAANIALTFVEIVLNLIAIVSLGTLVVYAAYAIGFSANKHKSLWTVLLIYAFYHLSGLAGIAVLIFAGRQDLRGIEVAEGLHYFQLFLVISFAVIMGVCVIFYLITNYFITKKLNLE